MSQRHIRQAAGWGPRVWAAIYYPQVLTLLMCAAYGSLIVGWSSALAKQPSSFEGTAGEIAMWIVAGMILIGSVVGIPTAIVGRYQVEKPAVFMVGTGLLLYAVIVYGIHITSEGGNRVPQAHTVIYAAIMCSIRYWWLLRHKELLQKGHPTVKDEPAEQ